MHRKNVYLWGVHTTHFLEGATKLGDGSMFEAATCQSFSFAVNTRWSPDFDAVKSKFVLVIE